MKTPMIGTKRTWDGESVRQMCIRHGYYTQGNSADYQQMLNNVELSTPTYEKLYEVAQDIFDHSDKEICTVEGIMFELEKETVNTFFRLAGRED